jgi:[ribosomal protein S5]-alanine N-acetyltransferase
MDDPGRFGTVGDGLRLRALVEDDLPFLDRLSTDPEALGYWEYGEVLEARARRKRWELDGYISAESTVLAVQLDDGTVAGIVSWRPRHRGGSPGVCTEVGCALLPEYRGKGLGTEAQRVMIRFLFGYTTVHRIEAITNDANTAEQRCLEKLGFSLDGVLRGETFQHGRYQDSRVYSLLRHEAGTHLGG